MRTSRPSFPFAAVGAVVAVATLLLAASPLPVLAQRPSLNVYFQSTLKDAAYQKAVFAKVSAAWKAPRGLPAVGAQARPKTTEVPW